jgi:hypothetical protein
MSKKPYVEKRRPEHSARVNLRMSREQLDALHRIAKKSGTNVSALLLSKVEPEIRRELRG